jgi:exodeoxyribonuclease-3
MLRIATWNVNGLRAVLRSGALERMVGELRPHVVCLQETRADLVDNEEAFGVLHDLVTPPRGMTTILQSVNRGEPHRAGVVVLGPAEGVRLAPRRDTWLYEDEGRVIGAIVQGAFVLLSVYAPNTGREERCRYKLQFLSRLGFEVAWLRSRGHVVVLAGDFNVVTDELDVHDWHGTLGHAGNREEERDEWLTFLRRRGTNHVDAWREFHPGERQYTWWDTRTAGRKRGRGWRIDTFVVDSALVPRVTKCTIHDDIQGSDHCPVTLDVEVADADAEDQAVQKAG